MATEGGSSGYILHHLTNLKLDLHTMALSTEAKGFWVLNLAHAPAPPARRTDGAPTGTRKGGRPS